MNYIYFFSSKVFKRLSIFLFLSFFLTCCLSPALRLSRITFFHFFWYFLTVFSHHHPSYHAFLISFCFPLFFSIIFFSSSRLSPITSFPFFSCFLTALFHYHQYYLDFFVFFCSPLFSNVPFNYH